MRGLVASPDIRGQLLAWTASGGVTASSGFAGGGSGSGVAVLADRHWDAVASYAPTGTALAGTAAFDPFGVPAGSTGTTAAVGFQGQWTDPATGDVHMGSRFYDPSLGIFLTRDSVDDPAANTTSFGYSAANPLSGVDLDGHNWFTSAVHHVTQAVSTGYHAVTNGMSTAYQTTTSALSPAYHWTANVVSTAWDLTSTAVSTAWQNAAAAATSLYQTSVDVLRSAVDTGKKAIDRVGAGASYVEHKVGHLTTSGAREVGHVTTSSVHVLKKGAVLAAKGVATTGKAAVQLSVAEAKGIAAGANIAGKAVGQAWHDTLGEHWRGTLQVGIAVAAVVGTVACVATVACGIAGLAAIGAAAGTASYGAAGGQHTAAGFAEAGAFGALTNMVPGGGELGGEAAGELAGNALARSAGKMAAEGSGHGLPRGDQRLAGDSGRHVGHASWTGSRSTSGLWCCRARLDQRRNDRRNRAGKWHSIDHRG